MVSQFSFLPQTYFLFAFHFGFVHKVDFCFWLLYLCLLFPIRKQKTGKTPVIDKSLSDSGKAAGGGGGGGGGPNPTLCLNFPLKKRYIYKVLQINLSPKIFNQSDTWWGGHPRKLVKSSVPQVSGLIPLDSLFFFYLFFLGFLFFTQVTQHCPNLPNHLFQFHFISGF